MEAFPPSFTFDKLLRASESSRLKEWRQHIYDDVCRYALSHEFSKLSFMCGGISVENVYMVMQELVEAGFQVSYYDRKDPAKSIPFKNGQQHTEPICIGIQL